MTYYDLEKLGFSTGMRVKVIRQRAYKRYNLMGVIGIVESNYGYGKVTVRFDDIRNDMSSRGVFYFPPADLEIVDDINIVKENNKMSKITNYLNAVKIQYVDNVTPSNYIYANFDANLNVGDLCVIKSANHGLGLARVTEILDGNNYEISTREVVAKVDTQDYDYRCSVRKDAAELERKMHERAKQMQDIMLYQMLAEKDTEMQELLARYQSLPKM